MLAVLKRLWTHGWGTIPKAAARGSGGRGRPVLDISRCDGCQECARACPADALTVETPKSGPRVSLRYDACISCGLCETACPTGAWAMTGEALPIATEPGQLVGRFASGGESPRASRDDRRTARTAKVFGRSLHIRQVDAGSCNGCEFEISALMNPVYDIQRFGIDFVASPRHADMLLVTGGVTRNLEEALGKTYEATPGPKMVVAVGACAAGGGMIGRTYANRGGVDATTPASVYVPGCPPRPQAILDGILTAIERAGQEGMEA